MQFISFRTRSGIKIIGQVHAIDERTVTVQITRARKPLTGKIMVFPKSDMIDAVTFTIKARS